MSTPVLSPAAAALLRELVARSGADRSDIVLTEVRSIDWRSLTFDGERHQMAMRFTGPDAAVQVTRMLDGLQEHEFSIPGRIVADIAVAGQTTGADGFLNVSLEALTISAD